MNTYQCPHCAAPLALREKSYFCPSGHTFDLSAEGYVNLAPPKGHTLSGDAPDSCKARRRFLEKGFYAPLAEALCDRLAAHGVGRANDLIIDAGCGEGYYSRFIKSKLPQADLFGVDLAKSAVKMAAKAEKNKPEEQKCHFAVAGIFALPFADQSAAAVVSVFAPIADAENLRVLRAGGVLAVACPGKRHLYGLKEKLYDTALENEEKVPSYDGFTLCEEKRISYPMALSGEQAADLFAMTPYFWRSSADIRERSTHLGDCTVEADFILKIYTNR